eukprot:jgi/Mesvir1/21856/Mv04236-RA.1
MGKRKHRPTVLFPVVNALPPHLAHLQTGLSSGSGQLSWPSSQQDLRACGPGDAAEPPVTTRKITWHGNDRKRPPHWQGGDCSKLFELIDLPTSSLEYATIASKLTAVGLHVSSVRRVQNYELWTRYATERSSMLRVKTGGAPVPGAEKMSEYDLNQCLLFHCSSAKADVICAQGLDARLANGGTFGRGIYLSDDPRKAAQYERSNTHCMYVCAAALGDCKAVSSNGSFVREPDKAPHERRTLLDLCFDSIVGNTGFNEYVLFHKDKVCPLYVVVFSHGSSSSTSNNGSSSGVGPNSASSWAATMASVWAGWGLNGPTSTSYPPVYLPPPGGSKLPPFAWQTRATSSDRGRGWACSGSGGSRHRHPHWIPVSSLASSRGAGGEDGTGAVSIPRHHEFHLYLEDFYAIVAPCPAPRGVPSLADVTLVDNMAGEVEEVVVRPPSSLAGASPATVAATTGCRYQGGAASAPAVAPSLARAASLARPAVVDLTDDVVVIDDDAGGDGAPGSAARWARVAKAVTALSATVSGMGGTTGVQASTARAANAAASTTGLASAANSASASMNTAPGNVSSSSATPVPPAPMGHDAQGWGHASRKRGRALPASASITLYESDDDDISVGARVSAGHAGVAVTGGGAGAGLGTFGLLDPAGKSAGMHASGVIASLSTAGGNTSDIAGNQASAGAGNNAGVSAAKDTSTGAVLTVDLTADDDDAADGDKDGSKPGKVAENVRRRNPGGKAFVRQKRGGRKVAAAGAPHAAASQGTGPSGTNTVGGSAAVTGSATSTSLLDGGSHTGSGSLLGGAGLSSGGLTGGGSLMGAGIPSMGGGCSSVGEGVGAGTSLASLPLTLSAAALTSPSSSTLALAAAGILSSAPTTTSRAPLQSSQQPGAPASSNGKGKAAVGVASTPNVPPGQPGTQSVASSAVGHGSTGQVETTVAPGGLIGAPASPLPQPPAAAFDWRERLLRADEAGGADSSDGGHGDAAASHGSASGAGAPHPGRDVGGPRCAICLDALIAGDLVMEMGCGHVAGHVGCCRELVSTRVLADGSQTVSCCRCVQCNRLFGTRVGTQPLSARMNVRFPQMYLGGAAAPGAIEITYHVPSGVEDPDGDNPGARFTGTSRVAYLPNTPEGLRVLDLLKLAFQRRLIFKVGTSVTTGMSNVVVWAGIHHKTSPAGGASWFGFPDDGYLDRVTEELRERGVC